MSGEVTGVKLAQFLAIITHLKTKKGLKTDDKIL
jgi:hypothetical protein